MEERKIPMNLQFFAEEGVTEQKPAVPGLEEAVETGEELETGEGATEQEPAEPAGQETIVQTPEENARYAAARRAAEAERKRLDESFAQQFGTFRNPVTGKAITSAQDYLDAMEAQAQMNRMRELQKQGIDPKMLNDVIANNPIMKQAQKLIAQQNESQAEQRIESDLKAITAIDPEIRSLDDLAKQENFQQILALVRDNGLSLDNAYRLANMDRLTQRQTAAAQQAVINQAKGKSHLQPVGTDTNNGQQLIDIPASELAVWKEYYPNLTMSELKKKYNETL